MQYRPASIGHRAAVMVALVACRFAPGQLDAAPGLAPDAPPDLACTTSYAACGSDGITLITCTAGSSSSAQQCPWGCVGSDAIDADPHCGIFTATGSAVTGSDFQGGAGDLTLDDAVVDTDSGMVTAGSLSMVWPGFHSVAVGNGVGVFPVGSLAFTGFISFTGTQAAAFVATGVITIDGIVDVRAPACNAAGGAGQSAGPGGFPGASANSSTSTSGAGGEAATDGAGGGGGGYAGSGGSGGYDNDRSHAGASGAAYGDAQVSLLLGGGGGGAASDNNGGSGGGGGGAIQLVSAASIQIGANGGIDAGGCGGFAPDGTHGGGGGGAGGAVVLEAPALTIFGQLAANGGGAGGGDSGSQPGSAGTLGSAAAPGGQGDKSDEDGGNGGAGATFVGATGPNGGSHAGGGGGGVGWIRLNSRAGSPTTAIGSAAVISPDPGAAGSPTTVAPAQVD